MSRRLIELALRAYPSGFRRRHAEELRDDLRRQRARAGRGPVAGARFWLRTLPDVFRAAGRLRLARRDGLHDPGTLHPRAALPGGGDLVHSLLQDLRHAARALTATPVASAAIALTLALGIGMNSAVFSVVDAVLLRPFDYVEPDQLVRLQARAPGADRERLSFSGGMLERMRDSIDSLEEIAGVTTIQQNLTSIETPVQVEVGWISPNLFRMLGAQPALGRLFGDDEPAFRSLLSYRLWQSSFAGDPQVIGRVVELDGMPTTIVGVLPPDFELHASGRPLEIGMWKTPDTSWANGDVWNQMGHEFALLTLVGRLAPDTSIEAAQREVDAFAAALRQELDGYRAIDWNVSLRPLHEVVIADVRPTLMMLLGAVAFVLLIACANIANLLLVRAGRREREISLRLALGSGRGRIVRLLLTESALLGLVGGGAGLLLAHLALRVMTRLGGDIPRVASATIDLRVLAFTVTVSLASALVFGLVPAWRVARRDLSLALRDARSSVGRGRQRLSRGLVVAQISLSLVLLIGAGLLTASLVRLQQVPTGIDSDDLLTFSISLPGTRYEWPTETGQFFGALEDRLATIPGVGSAGVVWPLPLSGSMWRGDYDGGLVEPDSNILARYVLATADVFDTLGLPLEDGRVFEDSDANDKVVVSRNLADRAWPGESPVGRTLRANPWGRGMDEYEVVGVVADARYSGLREPADEVIYFDARHWSWVDWEVDVLVRAEGAPLSLLDPIRDELARLDSEVPLAETRLMGDYIDDSLAANRFALTLLGTFATVAAALAVIGLYAVLSYAVGERTREIGIRLAMGSSRDGILRLVVGSGVRLAAAGLALGVAGALFLTRFLGAFLFDVEPTDAGTYLAVAASMLLVAALASWLPARRATRLDPMAVLRAD